MPKERADVTRHPFNAGCDIGICVRPTEFVGGYVAGWHVRSKRGAVNLGNGKLRPACCRLPSLVGGFACRVDNKFLAAERRIECAPILHLPFAVHYPVLARTSTRLNSSHQW